MVFLQALFFFCLSSNCLVNMVPSVGNWKRVDTLASFQLFTNQKSDMHMNERHWYPADNRCQNPFARLKFY